MPRNLELKIKIEDFEPVMNILIKMNADDKGILNQQDIYYNHSGSLLKLRLVNGRAEIITYRRDEQNPDRWSDYHVLAVDPGNAENFFGKIFEEEIRVIKKRHLYIYKNTRIHLDNVKSLGFFLELETVVTGNETEAKAEFEEVINLLELDKFERIKKSYKNILTGNADNKK